MNTSKLKTFAKEARLILIEGVKLKLQYWGFNEQGETIHQIKPVSGGFLLRGEVFDDSSIPKKWEQLKIALKNHSYDDIVEEAAYTWFNRLIAIKILEKNNYIKPSYSYSSDTLNEPVLLSNARRGLYENLSSQNIALVKEYLLNHKDEEAFAILLIDFCKKHKITNRIFGHIDDYTELLIPLNLLAAKGIINLLNNNDSITDEDYREVELIGWLYQFYISDKKDEIFDGFKKNKKARAEDLPAATQIFTPKWIVKYMVENTVGKIWLDYNPNSKIREELKYFVESENQLPIISDISDLTLMDPACGSGHILVEGFELFLRMYVEEGYSAKDAVELILHNNIFGLDIDDRAAQLANFALLLKAAKYNVDILNIDLKTNILSFPEPQQFDSDEIKQFLGKGAATNEIEIILNTLELLNNGKNFGSITKIKLTDEELNIIKLRANYFENATSDNTLDLGDRALWNKLKPFVNILLLLKKKYFSVVANPPYMSQKNLNDELKNYLNKEYPTSKSDLFAVFMEVCIGFVESKSFIGMINQQSWMFLSSFEQLRKSIINNYQIVSMLHLGAGTFREISGEVVQSTCFVLKKSINIGLGAYYRLLEYNWAEKEQNFILGNNRYLNISQSNFSKIPGSPIAYWVSENFVSIYENAKLLFDYTLSDGQNVTGNNDKYLRNIWEISKNKIGIGNKWLFYAKGGTYRRWWGNLLYVINWSQEARSFFRKDKIARIIPEYLWYKIGITWGIISSNIPSFRVLPQESTFDKAGSSIFLKDERLLNCILAFLNTKIVYNILKITNPTISLQVIDIRNLPILPMLFDFEVFSRVNEIVTILVELSKKDWNNHELSMDYQKNYLIQDKEYNSMIMTFEQACNMGYNDFFQVKQNEEELNRIFIEIYGLQDELTPEVPLKEITILQDETYINENNELVFKKDEIIKQFISYAVGCMMGRYSLYKEGLILANHGDTLDEYNKIVYNGNRTDTDHFIADEDGIIPVMSANGNFSDDIVIRFRNFLEKAFSKETLTENVNFITECLGMEIDKFLIEKLWLYHIKMYQKKPIYWMFSTKTGSFRVLVYMHRINKFTIQKIRNNYLLKHMTYLREEIAKLEETEQYLSTIERKQLDKMRYAELECREYEDLLKSYMEKQIELDLDDGVTVNYKKFESILAPIK